jgi:hypothetical protein
MSVLAAADEDATFELRIAPSIALVSKVRQFVAAFYAELMNDPDTSHKLAMATHEMLENAVSYSVDQRSELIVSLHRKGENAVVSIQTRNRATDERLRKVRNALDEVVNATDPDALYNQLVKRAAKRQDGGSGLGLGRIRAEADLMLRYTIEGDTLVVVAEGAFPHPASTPPPAPALPVER